MQLISFIRTYALDFICALNTVSFNAVEIITIQWNGGIADDSPFARGILNVCRLHLNKEAAELELSIVLAMGNGNENSL